MFFKNSASRYIVSNIVILFLIALLTFSLFADLCDASVIHIMALAPTAVSGGPYSIDRGTNLLLDGSSSYDPDAPSGDYIVEYKWDLNNDSIYDVSGSNVVVPWNTLETLLKNAGYDPIVYTDPETGLPLFIIKLQVKDSTGRTDTDFATLAIFDVQTEPDVPSGVALTKSGEDFIVGIEGWNSTHQYQIWTYQQVTSGIFETEDEIENQWILSHAYTLGSDRTAGGFTEVGSAITRNIGTFTSTDSNYTIAVRVIDGSGNFVGQYKDTYTQAEVGEVVINKVEVDGAYADERAQVKEITNGATVSMMVYGNGVEGTVFSARVDTTGEVIAPLVESPNAFEWDIGLLAPGNYSVTLTAATATSTDSRTVSFRLYKNDPAIVYGELTGLEVAGLTDSGNYQVDISPTVSSGDSFRYRLSEPWRSPFYDSGTTVVPAGVISDTNIPADKYGIYQVAVYTYRLGVASADDGDIKTVNNERGGVSLAVDVAVNETPAAGDPIAALKGDGIMLTAAATGIPSAEYSFWRRDANGWVLIRDYAAGGEVVWTPNRVGLYTIQVRAKDAAGLTYEAVQNIEFDITDAVDTKAVVTDITINQATLDSDAAARTPITITANAVSASEDLLYKFIISNGYIYYVETPYSVDPTYIWVPGKAGDYTISVLIKNRVSFGKYDAVGSFVVNVN